MPASGSVQTILSKLPRPKESHDHRIESRYVRNCRIGWRKESCQRPYCGMVERSAGDGNRETPRFTQACASRIATIPGSESPFAELRSTASYSLRPLVEVPDDLPMFKLDSLPDPSGEGISSETG